MKYQILVIGLWGSWLTLLAQPYRYTQTQFGQSQVQTNVTYGQAPFLQGPLYTMEESTQWGTLMMDIYQPIGDACNLRPAVIMAHPGGFITGSRQVDDMKALCDSLARKGYVSATIDYRQGCGLTENVALHAARAVYRGVQDGRAAVRYLRAHATEYGIDPRKIYMVGSSAGAFIALHAVFVDAAEKPAAAGTITYTNITPPFSHQAPDLGGLDVGDNLNYNGTPDAIVSLWGALQQSNWIGNNNTTPVLLVHGEADGTVPFGSGSPFGYSSMPNTEGSQILAQRLQAVGNIPYDTYFVAGQGHEFYGTTNGNWSNGTNGNSYWPVVLDKIEQFLWKQHKPVAQFSSTAQGLNVTFNDTGYGAAAYWWDFGDGQISHDPNPTHFYSQAGSYTVRMYIENDIKSWDETLQTVVVNPMHTDETGANQLLVQLFSDSNSLELVFPEKSVDISKQLEIIDISGKVVLEHKDTHNRIQLDTSTWPQSLYFLHIVTPNDCGTFKWLKF